MVFQLMIRVPHEPLNHTASSIRSVELVIKQNSINLLKAWNNLPLESRSKIQVETQVRQLQTIGTRLLGQAEDLSKYLILVNNHFIEADRTESEKIGNLSDSYIKLFKDQPTQARLHMLGTAALLPALVFGGPIALALFTGLHLKWLKGIISPGQLPSNGTIPKKPKVDKGNKTNETPLKTKPEKNDNVEHRPAPPEPLLTAAELEKMNWRNIDEKLLNDLNHTLEKYEINTPARKSHFLSQCAHESNRGLWTKELASGERYEFRSDLGNTELGDGPRYKGGGFIQLTGRYNYQQFSDAMGDPRIMEGVDYVSENYPWSSAGYWWSRNNMNILVDSGATVEDITRRVNNGLNGIEDRRRYYQITSEIFGG